MSEKDAELKQYIEKCVDELAIKYKINFGRITVEVADSKVVSCELTTKYKRENKKLS